MCIASAKACMHERIDSLKDQLCTFIHQAVTMCRCVCVWQVSCTVHERWTGGYRDSCRVMHWYCWQLVFANISRKAYWCLLPMQAFLCLLDRVLLLLQRLFLQL